MKNDYHNWVKNKLRDADSNFLRTKLGLLLKKELTRLGYWRNKARGNGGNRDILLNKHNS